MDVVPVCFPSEGSKGFRDLHKRLHLTREDALRFSRIEYLHAVRVQESHELVQVRPLLREFVRGLSQRLGINDPDCRIVGIGKELYPVEARIEGNNFDIGQLEQLSTKDKQDMLFELVGFIMCERFETINDFTAAALREFPEQYREIIVGYNSILERYCRGNYLNAERKRKRVEQSGAKE